MFCYSCCTCFTRQNPGTEGPLLSSKSRSEKDEQIAAIDAEVLRTEDAIVVLVKQRALLKRKRNTFSPAVNLPPEILSLIFEFACLPRHAVDTIPVVPSDNNHVPGSMPALVDVGAGAVTPLFIGTICTSWRNISRNSSQLWNTVSIRLRNRGAESQAALLQYWLARAGSRPLSIKLVEDDTNEEDDSDDWGLDTPSTAIIQVLAAHARQWHTVDMFLPATWKSTLARIAPNLLLLTRLTLRVAEGSPSMTRVTVFTDAPALREVTLIGYGVTDVLLPWAQLTRLDAECFSAFEAYETLRLCPSLRRCQLELLYRGIVPFTPQAFTHPTLETFELVVENAMGLGMFLDALSLPGLRHFVLALPDDSEERMMKWVVPLLRRSACHLYTLHLVGLTPEEGDLVECLRLVPALKTLLLLNPRVDSGGQLSERLLGLLNPTHSVHARWETLLQDQVAHGYARHIGKGQARSDEWDDENKGSALVSNPGMNCYTDGLLIPALEKLVFQGPIAFSTHSLVKCLLARWHRAPIPSPSSSPSRLGSNVVPAAATADIIALNGGDRMTGRLRSAVFTTPTQIQFEGTDSDTVQALLCDGMHLQFLVDPNVDV